MALYKMAGRKDVDLNDLFKALIEKCDKFEETITSSGNSFTRDTQLQIEGSWIDFVCHVLSSVSSENAWDLAVVTVVCLKFMFWLISLLLFIIYYLSHCVYKHISWHLKARERKSSSLIPLSAS